MDTNAAAALIVSLSTGVNRATEMFKMLILTRFPNLSAEQRKLGLVLFSLVAGLVTAFIVPNAELVFRALAPYPVVSRAALGISLGFGSEVAFWVLKIMSNLSAAPTVQNPPQDSAPQG